MEPREMLEILKRGFIRVYNESQKLYGVVFSNQDRTIYFWHDGGHRYYTRYDIFDENDEVTPAILRELASIVRIEKEIDSEYYPIWTREDGEITLTDKFVKLNGKYYTVQFLEQLIENNK